LIWYVECSLRTTSRGSEETTDSPPDGQTTQKLVPQRLGLSDGGETTVLDLFGVKLQRVLWELEPLGDEGGQLADAATLLTEDILGVGGTDDDLGLGGRGSDLATRVTLLGELTSARGRGIAIG
jgi:hypothetical protein